MVEMSLCGKEEGMKTCQWLIIDGGGTALR